MDTIKGDKGVLIFSLKDQLDDVGFVGGLLSINVVRSTRDVSGDHGLYQIMDDEVTVNVKRVEVIVRI